MVGAEVGADEGAKVGAAVRWHSDFWIVGIDVGERWQLVGDLTVGMVSLRYAITGG